MSAIGLTDIGRAAGQEALSRPATLCRLLTCHSLADFAGASGHPLQVNVNGPWNSGPSS